MAYENDVKMQMKILRDSISCTKSEQKRVYSLVNNANRWWKGKGGEAFIQEYQNIDGEADQFFRYMNKVADDLERLPALINRAELERKEEKAKANNKK